MSQVKVFLTGGQTDGWTTEFKCLPLFLKRWGQQFVFEVKHRWANGNKDKIREKRLTLMKIKKLRSSIETSEKKNLCHS